MRNAILIISHKRPECVTAKTLEKAGYGGEWYIVADDMDDTAYESLYGGHVIRFSKKEYIEKVDTADNFKSTDAAVYARNACFDIARQNGYDCFGLFDDDLTDFRCRFISKGTLASKRISNFTEIFDAYCEFAYNSGLAACGFITANRLIGGAKNKIVKNGVFHILTNAYIINTHKNQVRFIGRSFEDSSYSYLNNIRGNLVFACMPVTVIMKTLGTKEVQKGGCEAYYNGISKYEMSSYANIVMPSLFRWIDGGTNYRFSANLPRILSERWRK